MIYVVTSIHPDCNYTQPNSLYYKQFEDSWSSRDLSATWRPGIYEDLQIADSPRGCAIPLLNTIVRSLINQSFVEDKSIPVFSHDVFILRIACRVKYSRACLLGNRRDLAGHRADSKLLAFFFFFFLFFFSFCFFSILAIFIWPLTGCSRIAVSYALLRFTFVVDLYRIIGSLMI